MENARRRVVSQLVLDKGSLALAIGMGVLVLLLIAGTQVLDWYWPLLIALVSLGIGVYQLRKNLPSVYQLAQRIDHKLGLADALSTAVHFGEHPKTGAEAVCALQRREAEKTAAGVDLTVALPYTRSRYLLPAAGLLLVAGGMFALRYAVIGSLDLQPSLIEMAVDTFFNTDAQEAAIPQPKMNLRPQAFNPVQDGVPPDSDELTQVEPPDNPEFSDPLSESPDSAQTAEPQQGDPADKKGDENQDKGEEGENSQKGDPDNQQQSDQQGEPQDGQNAQSNEDQRSMLDKLRDALSNMLNDLKSDQGEQNSEKAGDQEQPSKEPGEKGDEQAERADGQPQSDAGQQGDQQNQQAQNSDQPGSKPSEDAANGAGKQDGEKQAEEAALLEAMGQMSEILGQRAEQISGELMVEVGETKQQLRTAFTAQQAGHSEAGGEIHRDEIPLLYQQFVARYFEQIHEPAAAPASTAPADDESGASPATAPVP